MDPANILFWNVRGYNGSGRQASVRNLVASLRIDVVCLQETKMEVISRVLVLQMLRPDFSNFFGAANAQARLQQLCFSPFGRNKWWNSYSLEGWLGFSWKLKD
jgi:hypothetical protein